MPLISAVSLWEREARRRASNCPIATARSNFSARTAPPVAALCSGSLMGLRTLLLALLALALLAAPLAAAQGAASVLACPCRSREM